MASTDAIKIKKDGLLPSEHDYFDISCSTKILQVRKPGSLRVTFIHGDEFRRFHTASSRATITKLGDSDDKKSKNAMAQKQRGISLEITNAPETFILTANTTGINSMVLYSVLTLFRHAVPHTESNRGNCGRSLRVPRVIFKDRFPQESRTWSQVLVLHPSTVNRTINLLHRFVVPREETPKQTNIRFSKT